MKRLRRVRCRRLFPTVLMLMLILMLMLTAIYGLPGFRPASLRPAGRGDRAARERTASGEAGTSGSTVDPNSKLRLLGTRFVRLFERHVESLPQRAKLDDGRVDDVCAAYRTASGDSKVFERDVWSSTSSPNLWQRDTCLAVHVSADRVAELAALADRWSGPISVALYVDFRHYEHVVGFWRANARLLRRTDIRLHLVAQHGSLYPVNELRNLAVAYSGCSRVLVSDVDFLPNVQLHAQLDRHFRRDSDPKRALVIPTFEFVPEKRRLAANVSSDKADVVRLIRRNVLKHFREGYVAGYRPLQLDRWPQAKRPYPVLFRSGMDPVVAVRRRHLPDFDRRFLGRNFNRISHLISLWAEGFSFEVLPESFIVHRQHDRPTKLPSYFRCIVDLREEFIREIKISHGISRIPLR